MSTPGGQGKGNDGRSELEVRRARFTVAESGGVGNPFWDRSCTISRDCQGRDRHKSMPRGLTSKASGPSDGGCRSSRFGGRGVGGIKLVLWRRPLLSLLRGVITGSTKTFEESSESMSKVSLSSLSLESLTTSVAGCAGLYQFEPACSFCARVNVRLGAMRAGKWLWSVQQSVTMYRIGVGVGEVIDDTPSEALSVGGLARGATLTKTVHAVPGPPHRINVMSSSDMHGLKVFAAFRYSVCDENMWPVSMMTGFTSV